LRTFHTASPRTPVNIGYVGKASQAPNYVQRVSGGTTTALSAPYKVPGTITEFFVKGEAAEFEVDVGRTRQD
jgi:hypothetical protein